MIINLAQAYLRPDKKDKCQGLLKQLDSSATGCEFKLAVAVLNKNNERAENFLKIVLVERDLKEKNIIEWTLFKEFRKTEEFLNAFKKLFDKNYAKKRKVI